MTVVRNMQVSLLKPNERPVCDPDRLVELCVQYGDSAAENIIARCVDQIIEALVDLETTFLDADFDALCIHSEKLSKLSDKIGMKSISRACNDLQNCIDAADDVALSAVFTRIKRLADKSLNHPWDVQGLSS